jgi:hypothetical protein
MMVVKAMQGIGWGKNALEYAPIAQVTAPRDRLDQPVPAKQTVVEAEATSSWRGGAKTAKSQQQQQELASSSWSALLSVDGRQCKQWQ